eukprot:gnl/Spiro4/7514_TR3931_c0_g2_i1.p1 gnl/Spiro4/7514_TR3931_c0_g2~~gnl/Spiro4/7514_TR3931_c0_g2_i1.p1  ORF type:complete len:102 (+),score=11.77 gnl/Spiro4/7514_TR3931_c0_g2_i1:332-637(+)
MAASMREVAIKKSSAAFESLTLEHMGRSAKQAKEKVFLTVRKKTHSLQQRRRRSHRVRLNSKLRSTRAVSTSAAECSPQPEASDPESSKNSASTCSGAPRN